MPFRRGLRGKGGMPPDFKLEANGLTELRTHSASLEDVFVTLTGRHLRDG